jgi:hypothetical protein
MENILMSIVIMIVVRQELPASLIFASPKVFIMAKYIT